MMHFYEPHLGHGLKHDPFNSIVGPRPIGWVSSQSASGVLNLAPYSFFSAFNYVPPVIGFSSIGRKDSLNNIEATGEFVWNLVTRDLAEVMNKTCEAVPPEVNEFELAGLTPEASRIVQVPRVAQSPVSFECRCTQILQLADVQGQAIEYLDGFWPSGRHSHRPAFAEGRGLRDGPGRPHLARWWRGRLLHHRTGTTLQNVPPRKRCTRLAQISHVRWR